MTYDQTIMSQLYTSVARPLLFLLDPERAHSFALHAGALVRCFGPLCRVLRSRLSVDDARLRQTIAGLPFENPLGLAAGFDKNGHAIECLGSLGFSHVEIGSVSAHRSVGNRRPRLFRLPQDQGIVVNYGVPNEGAFAVASRLDGRRCPVPLGINLVKTNDPARPPTDEEVLGDYAQAFVQLQPFADYVNLNLSCPNSANDRNYFDEVEKVARLLDRLRQARPQVPVFLKLKPTTDRGWLREFVAVADGFPFVAGFGINLPAGKPADLVLTTSREDLMQMPGAVAGQPVRPLIDANLRLLSEVIGPRSRYALVAAGGVFTGDDAYAKIRLGASLVQLYTAMIYQGPGVVRAVLRRLLVLLERDGFTQVSEAVGVDVHGRRSAVAR